MKQLIDPEQFVGMRGNVVPKEDDPFLHEFDGLCVGVRSSCLQVRDMDDEVYEIEVSQFTRITPAKLNAPVMNSPE